MILLLLVNEADCLAYQVRETEPLFQSLQSNTAIRSERPIPRSGLVHGRQPDCRVGSPDILLLARSCSPPQHIHRKKKVALRCVVIAKFQLEDTLLGGDEGVWKAENMSQREDESVQLRYNAQLFLVAFNYVNLLFASYFIVWLASLACA